MTTIRPLYKGKTAKKAKKHAPDKNARTLRACGFYSINEQNRVKAKLKDAAGLRPESIIYVAYRGDGNIRGAGAHFDHRSVQLTSDSKTAIVADQHTKVHLSEYMANQRTQQLPCTETTPELLSKCDGLLYLPGIPRNIKNSPEALTPRTAMYNSFIKDAINRGMPIFAVCGGSWALWQYFEGRLADVKDHCASRMPSLNQKGKVGYNVQIHRIKLTDNSLILKGAMDYQKHQSENPNPCVNSVHWLAPEKSSIPDYFEVSAYSMQDASLAPNSRQGQTMQPEEDSIECFESRFGAPVLGVQWHPEAYTSNTPLAYFPEQQRKIIKYMAQAGQTYKLKQLVNQELFNHSQRPASDSTLNIDTIRQARCHSFWSKAYLKEQEDKKHIVQENIDGQMRDVIVL